VVTKFAGADGRRLWSDRYNGTGDGDDAATSVAVDGQGNVVVTGTSAGAGGDLDLYTAAYDGRTGKRLWSERFDGIRGRDELAFPFGLALGPLNSVALAGSTQMTAPPNAEWDFLTVAYAVPSPQIDADADGLPDSWESTFFGTTVGHGPGDDADGDGVVERLEYAFGMNPTASDPDRVPAPVLDGGFLTLTLAKRSGASRWRRRAPWPSDRGALGRHLSRRIPRARSRCATRCLSRRADRDSCACGSVRPELRLIRSSRPRETKRTRGRRRVGAGR
jgi:hypothetical protein